MSDELREQFADLAHAIWAHWMRYMFSCGQQLADDTWIMPADKVKRWTRQMHTPYAELSDKERESDREQADKMIVLFEGAITTLRQRAEAAEAQVIKASDIVYDLIGELADATGKTRAELEEAFLGAVQP